MVLCLRAKQPARGIGADSDPCVARCCRICRSSGLWLDCISLCGLLGTSCCADCQERIDMNPVPVDFHHRRSRRPTTPPRTAHRAIVRLYHRAMNGKESSVQCSA